MSKAAAITVAQPALLPAVPTSADEAILALIERAARDPSVDIDKMERLFGMHERMKAGNAKAAYLTALSAMQPELPVIDKRGSIKTNEKDAKGEKTGNQKKQSAYAKWEDVVEAIAPVLARHGFSMTFRIAQPGVDRVVVTAVLGHAGGHSEETAMGLPLDSTGSKNNVQGWGSSVSYGKRYTAFALLNIVGRSEDDDGQAAGAPTPLSPEQMTALQRMIDENGVDVPAFCEYFGIAVVTALPAAKFEAAKAAILRRRK